MYFVGVGREKPYIDTRIDNFNLTSRVTDAGRIRISGVLHEVDAHEVKEINGNITIRMSHHSEEISLPFFGQGKDVEISSIDEDFVQREINLQAFANPENPRLCEVFISGIWLDDNTFIGLRDPRFFC